MLKGNVPHNYVAPKIHGINDKENIRYYMKNGV